MSTDEFCSCVNRRRYNYISGTTPPGRRAVSRVHQEKHISAYRKNLEHRSLVENRTIRHFVQLEPISLRYSTRHGSHWSDAWPWRSSLPTWRRCLMSLKILLFHDSSINCRTWSVPRMDFSAVCDWLEVLLPLGVVSMRTKGLGKYSHCS